jgi:hypothetical protein
MVCIPMIVAFSLPILAAWCDFLVRASGFCGFSGRATRKKIHTKCQEMTDRTALATFRYFVTTLFTADNNIAELGYIDVTIEVGPNDTTVDVGPIDNDEEWFRIDRTTADASISTSTSTSTSTGVMYV